MLNIAGGFNTAIPTLPVARISPVTDLTQGDVLILDGSNSEYAETYLWEQISGQQIKLQDPRSPTTEQNINYVGRRELVTFSLEVRNSNNLSNKDYVSFFVNPHRGGFSGGFNSSSRKNVVNVDIELV